MRSLFAIDAERPERERFFAAGWEGRACPETDDERLRACYEQGLAAARRRLDIRRGKPVEA